VNEPICIPQTPLCRGDGIELGSPLSPSSASSCRKNSTAIRTETVIKETILHGFEQVITVTEETINVIFKTLWEAARKSSHADVLHKWSIEGKFSAVFDQPRIQLLSDDKALIWILLHSGSMHIDGHSESETTVSGWRLAFEVKLKQVKHSELGVDKTWFERFGDALSAKSQEESSTIEHVVLDFEST
jgi:hypothetical protein